MLNKVKMIKASMPSNARSRIGSSNVNTVLLGEGKNVRYSLGSLERRAPVPDGFCITSAEVLF